MDEHRLEIDWTRCDGHGLCSRLLPERIGLDEFGFPVPTPGPVSETLLDAARLAARSCPALALRITRTATGS